jgi:hypothetical protein
MGKQRGRVILDNKPRMAQAILTRFRSSNITSVGWVEQSVTHHPFCLGCAADGLRFAPPILLNWQLMQAGLGPVAESQKNVRHSLTYKTWGAFSGNRRNGVAVSYPVILWAVVTFPAASLSNRRISNRRCSNLK